MLHQTANAGEKQTVIPKGCTERHSLCLRLPKRQELAIALPGDALEIGAIFI